MVTIKNEIVVAIAVLSLLSGCAEQKLSPLSALADVQMEPTLEQCDEQIIPGGGNIYLHNISQSKYVDATIQIDTAPTGQLFVIFNGSIVPFTEHFPKTFVVSLPPGGRQLIGCSSVDRPTVGAIASIGISMSLVGASYNGGTPPVWPADDPTQYIALLIAPLAPCGPGSHQAGIFYVMNLHPGRRIRAIFNVVDKSGKTIGRLTPDISPNGFVRAFCSNADVNNNTISNLESATYSGPASLKIK